MKNLFLFAAIFSVFTLTAQNNWYNDYNTAKTECKNAGKLMVIDFWADWCKPCKIMDEKLWNNADVQINYGNFVGVRINVDEDRETPEKFTVTGIPKIVIALPDGEILWEKTGFYDEQEFVEVLNSIPANVSELYQTYFSVLKLTKDSKCAFDIANQFQQLAGKIENKDLKYAFIQQDEAFFKKAMKDNTAPSITCHIELYLLLNDIYNGKPDKAIKKFNKTYKSVENCQNKELAHFFLAQYYKAIDDMENFSNEVSMITEDEFVHQLE